MKFLIALLFKNCRRYDDLSKRAYDEVYRIEKQIISLYEFQFGLDENDDDFIDVSSSIRELFWQRDYVVFLFRSFDNSIFDELSEKINFDDFMSYPSKFSIVEHNDL